ncbi:major facilitator superfamily (MFS) transporter [Candidatus Koribacter versatilis Ellin345]|uniref:Major facilitator superfamily (MFS) transporter n=1 Tax=Koribacter versatilis (strain Ellin345) TaxID=204669 RepID=Q1INA6_KORVE|nr:MFS transporter [Candidatus Koribacter versatilis]ABF41644.1 major facilitator superfamily (MFS) transporter [Candidatus Koribacter versatilis Ellin345]
MFSLPAFRTIWMGQFVSIFGDFVAIFAVVSMITFRWHGSATQVTIAITLALVPLAIIGPPAGVLVDHWNVKRVMIGSDLSRAVIAVLLAWMTNSWQIGMVLFALGCASSLFVPAQSIAVRTLIPRERLLQANAMLMQAFYLIRIISPLVAAAIVSALSEKACFYIDSGSFVFSALMIATLTIHRPPREGADKTLSGLSKDFAEGNRFIFTHPGLSFVFLAMAIAMFVMSSFMPLISIFVRDVLHGATRTYGVVSSCVGFGMILGTTLVTKISRGKARPGVVVMGLLSLGVATAVLATSRIPFQAGVSTFLMGFSIAMVLIPAQTMSQQETPPQMVGRVSSTFMSMISIAQVFGLLLSGSAAQRLGMQRLFAVCSAVLVVIAAAGWMFLRSRRQPEAAAA